MLLPCSCVALDSKASDLSVAEANGVITFVFLAAGATGDVGPSPPCPTLWSHFGRPYIEGHRVEQESAGIVPVTRLGTWSEVRSVQLFLITGSLGFRGSEPEPSPHV